MREPDLVPLAGLHGRCGSDEALAAARRLAGDLDPDARVRRIEGSEGLTDDGTAARWEISFDLVDRMADLDVIVTFVREESSGRWGAGVAALDLHPFPPPGSELERMLVRGEIPRRRLPGLWRQTLAERRPLPPVMPAAGDAIARVRVDGAGLRAVEASVSRLGGPRWTVTTRTGEHVVRFEASASGWRFAG